MIQADPRHRIFEIGGCHSGVDEDLSLLTRDTVSLVEYRLTLKTYTLTLRTEDILPRTKRPQRKSLVHALRICDSAPPFTHVHSRHDGQAHVYLSHRP